MTVLGLIGIVGLAAYRSFGRSVDAQSDRSTFAIPMKSGAPTAKAGTCVGVVESKRTYVIELVAEPETLSIVAPGLHAGSDLVLVVRDPDGSIRWSGHLDRPREPSRPGDVTASSQ